MRTGKVGLAPCSIGSQRLFSQLPDYLITGVRIGRGGVYDNRKVEKHKKSYWKLEKGKTAENGKLFKNCRNGKAVLKRGRKPENTRKTMKRGGKLEKHKIFNGKLEMDPL